MGETEILPRMRGNCQVLGGSEKTELLKSAQNRELVSIVEAISAEGQIIKLLVIFKGLRPSSGLLV